MAEIVRKVAVLDRIENIAGKERENMLGTSIISSFHNVFEWLLFQGSENQGLFVKGFTL